MKRFHRLDLTDAATFSAMIYSDDQGPARVAYAMVLAVSRHIEDLTEDDAVDASEGFTSDELKQARSAVRQLERVYADVINRVQLRLEPNTTKNADGRTFPYARLPELKKAIDRQWAEHQRLAQAGRISPYVFTRNGQRIKSMLKAFKAACVLAGCPGRIPHDFRRTELSNLERAGVPRSQAMKLTGHLTESVYRRYAIVSEADLEVAGERLALFTSKFTSGAKAR
jgi:hypothetical protein